MFYSYVGVITVKKNSLKVAAIRHQNIQVGIFSTHGPLKHNLPTLGLETLMWAVFRPKN
jgi:hypothetical protein